MCDVLGSFYGQLESLELILRTKADQRAVCT